MTMTPMPDRSCGECPLHSRRQFMRDAALSVAAALAAAGVMPRLALAMPRAISSLSDHGAEVRYPIPAADGVSIDAEREVIIARAGGRVFAFALACPHQRTALRWQASGNRFRCPKHKSVFNPDGTLVEGRAKRPMDRFALRRDGDAIVVDVSTLHRFDKAQAAWEAAVVVVTEK